MQRQTEDNDQQHTPRRAHHPQQHDQNEQDHLQQLMQNRRRQKTLSSISNFVPLHILLSQPRGVSLSLTVPKSFTIEQLARQIEAEYAYMVEREVGHSRYPVIECGALFDHVELPPRRRRGTGRTSGRYDHGSLSQDYEDEDDEEDEEECVDERDEAESRGVQLRFSDRVEDVLERGSTVHVVNIDQVVGIWAQEGQTVAHKKMMGNGDGLVEGSFKDMLYD
ncbi:hypothetical protein KI688_004261 [Linnemannia hyalina]|uniref:Uncharacterized protein n=1 Tax=Linnemannia hyalina TaxID=64524 RepID=A0A9P7XMC5_9FUNG|nr:hypothetical protein KI688_004261 [Linnemannia hyalina]